MSLILLILSVLLSIYAYSLFSPEDRETVFKILKKFFLLKFQLSYMHYPIIVKGNDNIFLHN